MMTGFGLGLEMGTTSSPFAIRRRSVAWVPLSVRPDDAGASARFQPPRGRLTKESRLFEQELVEQEPDVRRHGTALGGY
jgi:hypothetical protein